MEKTITIGRYPYRFEIKLTFGTLYDMLDNCKLSTDVNEDEDDDVFFYCDGIDELLKLTEPDNGEDFVITGFEDFYETL